MPAPQSINQSINHARLNAPFARCAKTKNDTSLAFAFAIVPPRMLNRLIYYTVRVCVESLIAKKEKPCRGKVGELLLSSRS